MKTNSRYLDFMNAAALRLLGEKAYDSSPQVTVSSTGSFVIDRESLHSSEAYKRQLEALDELERKDSEIQR